MIIDDRLPTTAMKQTSFNAVDRSSLAARRLRAGFSLIEVIVAVAIFLIIGGGVYFTYANIVDVLGRTRTRTLATSLVSKHVEAIRNLPFDSVGTVGGYPVGVIPATSTVSYEGNQFLVTTTVRNIDDAFDGKQGQTPNDTAPADYKLVEITVHCSTCFNFPPLSFTTWVAPQNLESSTRNGSLFVNVFNANGQPISDANVSVRNTALSPSISIDDVTNNSGTLQLVDIPTSTTAYRVTVSKSGYTSAQTYSSSSTNPNPIPPHATVASQQITSISFAIDKVSDITVATQDKYCAPVSGVSLIQNGTKKIGTAPDVLLYSKAFTTDSSGLSSRSNLEWDTYSFAVTSALHHLAGYTPLLPLTIAPSSTTMLSLFIESAASSSLLVGVKNASGTPIADVQVQIDKTGVSTSTLTGRNVHRETDWSNGRYAAQDGNIDDATPAGSLTIKKSGGLYATSTNSFLESTTIDFGTATTTFHTLSWAPLSQPSNTSLKFQLASASASTGPWSYLGPDGTGSTYYTSTSSISSAINGGRYVRYKIFMNTTSDAQTPQLDEVSIVFSSGCVPSGHAFFAGIPTGSYDITASKSGYQTATTTITVGSGWQEASLIMQ